MDATKMQAAKNCTTEGMIRQEVTFKGNKEFMLLYIRIFCVTYPPQVMNFDIITRSYNHGRTGEVGDWAWACMMELE